MKPHPPEVREQARRWYAEGWTVKAISRELGTGYNTVKCWVNDDFRLKQNEKNRQRKKQYGGKCVDCGGRTGSGKHGYATRCNPCHQVFLRENRKWPREAVLAAIHRWAAEHEGRPPRAKDWASSRGEDAYWPSYNSVYGPGRAFATWGDAIVAAGFPKPRSSPGPHAHWFDRDEARRLRAEGLTDIAIAERFGVSPSAIGQALGPRDDSPPRRPVRASKRRTREQRIADLQAALRKENE